jgi:hypothetical protein
MSVLGYFDDAYYVNLEEATKRRALMEAELLRMGMQAHRVQSIPATDNSRRARQVSLLKTLISIMEDAKSRNLKNVLIMEDDNEFAPGFWNHWETAKDFLNNNPWDVFYFYRNIYYETDAVRHYDPNTEFKIVQIYENFCLNCCAFSSRVFDNVLLRWGHMMAQGKGADELFWQSHTRLGDIKIYAPTLNLAGQREGDSFIEQYFIPKRWHLAE